MQGIGFNALLYPQGVNKMSKNIFKMLVDMFGVFRVWFFIKARRIINGTNEDDRIADYAVKFLDCIILSEPPTRVS